MWPMHLQRLKLLRPTVKKQMHFQENTVQCMRWCPVPLHHVTYASAKFDFAKSNGLGDAFT